MAEQTKRPQVRKVWLHAGVFLPDGGGLAGDAGKQEIDAEGSKAMACKLVMTIMRDGVMCSYVGGKHEGARAVDVPHRVLIPWSMVRQVDVDAEWKP